MNDSETQNKGVVFIKEVAKYFRDFLETDFHKRRYPKRYIKLRNEDNLNIGLNLHKYPSFQKLIWKAINNTFDNNAIKNIDKGAHRSDIPHSILDLITLQAGKLTEHNLSDIIKNISVAIETNAVLYKDDLDKALTMTLDDVSKIMLKELTLPFVNNLVKPIENLEIGDEGSIFLMEEELTDVLVKSLEDKILELLKSIIAGIQVNILENIKQTFAIKDVQTKIIDFFENFKVNDIFLEIFDMDRNKGILDKQEFYFYFCDITFNKVKYPIFYIPFNLLKASNAFKIEFDSEVFVNKKALDYIVQEYNVSKSTRGNLKQISERIIYLAQHSQDFVEITQEIVDEITNFFELDKRINLRNPDKQVSKSLLVRMSNSCYFCLFDKSDEALINDYEEILEKISEGDDELANAFVKLVDNFINKNPQSFNSAVEDEWDTLDTSSKLVYASPIPLNSEQRQILSAINKEGCKYVITEGPPGTGKSHTITAIVCDAILNNKSVLVLSDKKEALDVVEDKITETMNNVRIDKNFQNPLLRLGKTGNTYNQILSNASIENIKMHYRAVRHNSKELKDRINKHTHTLKEDIDSEILFYNKISLKDICDLLTMEAKLNNENLIFNFQELHKDKDGAENLKELRTSILMLYHEFYEAGNKSILSDFLHLSANDFVDYADFIKFLHELIKVGDIAQKLNSFFKKAIRNLDGFNEFSDKSLAELEGFIKRYESLKTWYFGYLFKNKQLRLVNDQFKTKFPYARYKKPHRSLKNFKLVLDILNYALKLKSQLDARVLNKIDYLGLIHACIVEPKNLARLEDLHELIDAMEETLNFCKKHPKTAEIIGLQPSDFKTVIKNRFIDIGEIDFESQIKLFHLKQSITINFNSIPTIDYVTQSKNLEELVTTEMTYVMDERLINFYENSKATARSLREIIKTKQKFPREEFAKLKEAFPCILAGIRDYADYIPLEPDIFDLVIIDEASQVSISQAFPALLRAKKIVIFGDRKQFSNVKAAHARSDANREYLNSLSDIFKTNVSTDSTKLVRLNKFNIKTSILEFFEFISNFNIQLTKHFRGYKETISYSNKHFYKDTLQVMKIRGKPIDQVIKFSFIEHDGKIEPILNTNSVEINFIINELKKLKENNCNMTLGIITPHTNQQKLLMDKISQLKESDYFFDNMKLKIMTFDTCQGEERDIIYYSMVATKEMDRLWGVFIKDLNLADVEDEEGRLKIQRLNVGFSRARECMHFVLSKSLDEYEGSVAQALKHYANVLEDAKKERSIDDVDQNSPKEKEVLSWFYQTEFWKKNKDSIEFLPQFKIGEYLRQLDKTYKHPNYVVDFLLIYNDPKKNKDCKIIIEYDGFQEHFRELAGIDRYNYSSYYSDEDVYRQKVLMGYGYKFLRINKFNMGDNPINTLNQRIINLINDEARQNEFLNGVHNDISNLQSGSKKECPKCGVLRDIEDFRDSNLISGVSRYCSSCKTKKKEETKDLFPTYFLFDKKRQFIEDAIKNKKIIEITYRGRYGRITSRKIKPLHLNGSLLRAYCYFRNDERTFNLTRMKIKE